MRRASARVATGVLLLAPMVATAVESNPPLTDDPAQRTLPPWVNKISPVESRPSPPRVDCGDEERVAATDCPAHVRSLFDDLANAGLVFRCRESLHFTPRVLAPHRVEAREVRCFFVDDEYACHLLLLPAVFDRKANDFFYAWAPLTLDEVLRVHRSIRAGQFSGPDRFAGVLRTLQARDIGQINESGNGYALGFRDCACHTSVRVQWREGAPSDWLEVTDVNTICT